MWYAAAAALMATDDAGLSPSELQTNPRVGVIIGSSRGGIKTLTQAQPPKGQGRRISPFTMSATTPYMAAAAPAMKLGISGPCLGVSSACTSGTLALIEAAMWIATGKVDIVLAGGTDAALCPAALRGYDAARLFSRRKNPEEASRPFDNNRDGFVVSEGACVLIMENPDHALRRGVPIYGSLIGSAHATSPDHETSPDAVAAASAMTAALVQANIRPQDVGAISAHAPATIKGDAAEATAIHQAFGPYAEQIPVFANKSQTGHMLGASEAVEAALAFCALKEATVPPTLNHEKPDPSCRLLIRSGPNSLGKNVIVSNSFGFGGSNAVIVLARFP